MPPKRDSSRRNKDVEIEQIRAYAQRIIAAENLESPSALKASIEALNRCITQIHQLPISFASGDLEVEIINEINKMETKLNKTQTKKRSEPERVCAPVENPPIGHESSGVLVNLSSPERTAKGQSSSKEWTEFRFAPFQPASKRLEREMRGQRRIWSEFKALESLLLPLVFFPPDTGEQLHNAHPALKKLPDFMTQLESDNPPSKTTAADPITIIEAFEDWLVQLEELWRVVKEEYTVRTRDARAEVYSPTRPKAPQAFSPASTSISNQSSTKAAPLLLAKTSINPFKEDPKSWLDFRRTLNRLRDDTVYSDEMKFEELHKATKEHPLANNIVRKYSENSNLVGAIEELIQRFENPVKVMDRLESYVRQSVKTIPEGYNNKHWETFYCEVQFVQEQLKLAKADKSSRDRMVKPLREKLPRSIRCQLRKQHSEFEEFTEFVEEIYEAQVEMSFDSIQPAVPVNNNNNNKRFPKQTRQVAAVSTARVTQPKSVARDPSTSCVFCPADDHISRHCSKTPDQRRQRLWAQKICFQCLKHPHPHDCKETCPFCDGRHHLLICKALNSANRLANTNRRAPTSPTSMKQSFPNQTVSSRPKEVPQPSPSVCSSTEEEVEQRNTAAFQVQVASPEVVMEMRGTPIRQVLLCQIMHQGRVENIRIFIDPGSEVTLLHPALLTKLGMDSTQVRRMLITGPGAGPQLCDQQVAFRLVALDGSYWCRVQAWVYPGIEHVSVPALPVELKKKAEAAGVKVPEELSSKFIPDLIIGVDYADRDSFTAKELRRISPAILASLLPFGWALRGFYEYEVDSQTRQLASYKIEPATCDCGTIKDIFGMDEFEAKKSKPVKIKYDVDQKRYVVELPWIGEHRPTNNYGSARAQAMSLRKRLRESGHLEAYHLALSEFLDSDYAEVAEPRYQEESFYLPHHPVIKPDAMKTRVRPVFNASASVKDGESLNQCLARGEPIHCDLLSSLIIFRLAPIPLVSDMIKAFLQVKIAEKDRDYVRYFWFEHPEDVEPTIFKLKSLLFGANCSPHILGAVLKRLISDHSQKMPHLRKVNETIYMDDLILDVESEDLVEEVMKEATSLLQEGSFGLHDWITTEAVRQSHPKMPFKPHDKGELSKCLGVLWSPASDKLVIECKAKPPETVTRRTAASFLARLYDPLGLLLPFKVSVRKFCRDMCINPNSWDATLPEELTNRFHLLVKEYQNMRVEIPRSPGSSIARLVIFVDASPEAFGAVAYILDENNSWTLLCSKGKLTPMKVKNAVTEEVVTDSNSQSKPSIPRLELCAAVLGSELFERLSQSPRLQNVPCDIYSDSQITLYRIKNRHRLHSEIYVQNRLDRIRELTKGRVNWLYVRTTNNPADLLTHGLSMQELVQKDIWWNGPNLEALLEDQEVMINYKPKDDDPDLGGPLQTMEENASLAAISVSKSKEEVSTTSSGESMQTQVSDGKWSKILHLSYGEAIQMVKEMVRSKNKSMKVRNHGKMIPLDEESYVVVKLWRAVQRDIFGKDYQALRQQKRAQNYRLRNSNSFMDEWGLIRTTRPLPNVFSYSSCRPIVIADHPMWRSFIRTEHHRLMHPGAGFLINHVTEHFHAFKGRQLIRELTKRCFLCNKTRGKAFSAPMAALPVDRTTEAVTPFTAIGLDFFGPVHLSKSRKIYGLLFSCNRTRAIHLEAVTSLSTSNCLMALQRFFARRGIPEEVRSDNAKTFQATNTLLVRLAHKVEEATQDPKIQDLRIKWKFNAPRAPWWGGHFERLIGTVKGKLAGLEWNNLSLESIWTVFCEIEAIINSRPLVGMATGDELPLTPAHFYAGKRLISLPGVPSFPNPEPVLRTYFKLRQLTSHFWRRWTTEYVMNLKRAHRDHAQSREPEVGEWVLVEDMPKPRGKWPMAKIVKIYPGQDGVVRLAEVQTANGTRLARAVQSLIPLEASPAGSRRPPEYVTNQNE